jgi:hypothetical protein
MDLQLPVQSVQSVPITTRVASSNSGQSDVSSIQHYVIKLVSDLRQVRGFLSIHYVFSYNILEESVYVLLVKDEHSKT